MENRKLSNGIQVQPLAFGGNVFGWTVDEKTSFGLLDAFTAAGMNLIDTADVYYRWAPGNKGGESETIIGKWMKVRNNRSKLVVMTKVGGDMGQGKTSLNKDHILKAAEDSLRRLQTDYIDVYLSHWDDLETPVSETMEAYAQLVKEGKVRSLGASNLSAERLMASIEFSEQNSLPAYEVLQPEYNLYKRENFEQTYESICLQKNLGVVNYYALASGFLTGKYRVASDADKSVRGAAIIKKYLNDRGLSILSALDQVAKAHNTEPASIALAWLIHRPSITAPIASATSVQQLDAMIEATQLQLSAEEMDLLNEASAY
jgi:aryl-alcohol dehydrogenase-like predicted oxidoreductase